MRLPHIPYWPLLLGPLMSLGLGLSINALVIGVNHGLMPVLAPGCGQGERLGEIWSCMAPSSHLKFLADWIHTPNSGIASPADFLIWACEGTWLPALSAW